MKLNPITLQFCESHQHLEAGFLNDYLKNSLAHIRLALILGCLLFAIFGVLDAILIPAKKHLIWAIRYGIICPSIIFVIFLSYVPKFQKWLQPILSALIVVSGGGIVAMIVIAPPPISYSYYAGLILIIMFGYTFIRVRFISAAIAGWIVVLLYEIAALFYQTPMPVLINNNFFFVSANVIGMLACYSIEFYTRRAYFLNWLLIKEKEKVHSINRELEKRVEKRTTQLKSINEDLSLEIRDRKQSEDINKTLFAISNAVNITSNLDDLYKQIHSLLGKIIDVTNFFIAIVNEKERTLYFPYYVDTVDDDFSPITNFNPKDFLTGYVVSNRKPLLLKRKRLQELADRDGVWGPVPVIWMGVPLIIRDEIIGVIVVQSYTDSSIYIEQDLEVLISISDQMAVAIDRKRTEAELQLKNLVFESAITANSASNAESLLTNVNKTFLKLWGYEKKEDVLGKSIALFFKFEHEAKVIITSLDETGAWEGEFTGLKRDGNTFVAYGLATTIHGLSEGITGYQSSVIDISDRKEAEKKKIEAQKIAGENEKLALVGQIAGKMAHDFNNVLGIIMGHSELALLKFKDLEVKNTFELIFNQTLSGKNLTKNLITFAKSTEPKQEFFSINEKIDLVLNLLKNDLEGIEILKDELDRIDLLADPGMIEHSLVNLVQNSIHATSLTENPQIIIRIYCLGKTVVLEIEDNGCGIPEEYIDNIYEPSFSLKGSQDVHGEYKNGIKGTGYGIANVKKYIELHNGNIVILSKSGSGTKVTITLPMIGKELTKDEVSKNKRTKNHSGKYILIVEDEPAISDVQYQILTQTPINHKVDIASNGKIAIEMLDKNQYDLVSLDYMLPGKINGIDVYHQIREANTSVPILFISGNIEFLESIKMLKQNDPYLAHLSKPCMNIDYLNGINKLFENLMN